VIQLSHYQYHWTSLISLDITNFIAAVEEISRVYRLTEILRQQFCMQSGTHNDQLQVRSARKRGGTVNNITSLRDDVITSWGVHHEG